jgi:hypothetical protein
MERGAPSQAATRPRQTYPDKDAELDALRKVVAEQARELAALRAELARRPAASAPAGGSGAAAGGSGAAAGAAAATAAAAAAPAALASTVEVIDLRSSEDDSDSASSAGFEIIENPEESAVEDDATGGGKRKRKQRKREADSAEGGAAAEPRAARAPRRRKAAPAAGGAAQDPRSVRLVQALRGGHASEVRSALDAAAAAAGGQLHTMGAYKGITALQAAACSDAHAHVVAAILADAVAAGGGALAAALAAQSSLPAATETLPFRRLAAAPGVAGTPRALRDGATALDFAALHGAVECVTLLLNAGADARAAGARLEGLEGGAAPPLALASAAGHCAVLRALLRAGADVRAQSPEGWQRFTGPPSTRAPTQCVCLCGSAPTQTCRM